MQHFIEIAINWVTVHWPALTALVGGGAGLSVLLQYVIHKLHIDSKKVAYTLIHLLSVASALSAYYVANDNVIPAYAGLVIIAQTAHRFFVSPIYSKKVLPYLTFLSENAAVPATQPEPIEEAQMDALPAFVN
jgi:hypothetical protein